MIGIMEVVDSVLGNKIMGYPWIVMMFLFKGFSDEIVKRWIRRL